MVVKRERQKDKREWLIGRHGTVIVSMQLKKMLKARHLLYLDEPKPGTQERHIWVREWMICNEVDPPGKPPRTLNCPHCGQPWTEETKGPAT